MLKHTESCINSTHLPLPASSANSPRLWRAFHLWSFLEIRRSWLQLFLQHRLQPFLFFQMQPLARMSHPRRKASLNTQEYQRQRLSPPSFFPKSAASCSTSNWLKLPGIWQSRSLQQKTLISGKGQPQCQQSSECSKGF